LWATWQLRIPEKWASPIYNVGAAWILENYAAMHLIPAWSPVLGRLVPIARSSNFEYWGDFMILHLANFLTAWSLRGSPLFNFGVAAAIASFCFSKGFSPMDPGALWLHFLVNAGIFILSAAGKAIKRSFTRMD